MDVMACFDERPRDKNRLVGCDSATDTKHDEHSAMVSCSEPVVRISRACTVDIEGRESSDAPTRVLALRDEHPDRAWDPLGRWWPETPSVIGVHDRKAGGAWLSIDEERRHLAVILNRGEPVDDG